MAVVGAGFRQWEALGQGWAIFFGSRAKIGWNQWPNFSACPPTVRVFPWKYQWRAEKVFTSSDVLFSVKMSVKSKKKRSSRPQMSCSPLKMSVKREKRSSRPQMSCSPLKMSVKSKKKVFTWSDVLFFPENIISTPSDVLQKNVRWLVRLLLLLFGWLVSVASLACHRNELACQIRHACQGLPIPALSYLDPTFAAGHPKGLRCSWRGPLLLRGPRLQPALFIGKSGPGGYAITSKPNVSVFRKQV